MSFWKHLANRLGRDLTGKSLAPFAKNVMSAGQSMMPQMPGLGGLGGQGGNNQSTTSQAADQMLANTPQSTQAGYGQIQYTGQPRPLPNQQIQQPGGMGMTPGVFT
jgi:hypothetical protein